MNIVILWRVTYSLPLVLNSEAFKSQLASSVANYIIAISK